MRTAVYGLVLLGVATVLLMACGERDGAQLASDQAVVVQEAAPQVLLPTVKAVAADLERGKGEAVERVVGYLSHFGYFPSSRLGAYGLKSFVGSRPASIKGVDAFRGWFAAGLSALQGNYGLEATGRYDDPTRELMRRPRCGFPDHAMAAQKVAPVTRWNVSRLTWTFTNWVGYLDGADLNEVIDNAFERWDAVCGLRLLRTCDEADIRVAWHGRSSLGNGDSGFGNARVLAHAFPPGNGLVKDLRGDVHFSSYQTWAMPAGPGQYDLETIALHEIGHALGLLHNPGDRASIMYPYFAGGQQVHRVTRDAVVRIQQLYGPP